MSVTPAVIAFLGPQEGRPPGEPLKTMSTLRVVVYYPFADQHKLVKFYLKLLSLLIIETGIGKRQSRKERETDDCRDNIY